MAHETTSRTSRISFASLSLLLVLTACGKPTEPPLFEAEAPSVNLTPEEPAPEALMAEADFVEEFTDEAEAEAIPAAAVTITMGEPVVEKDVLPAAIPAAVQEPDVTEAPDAATTVVDAKKADEPKVKAAPRPVYRKSRVAKKGYDMGRIHHQKVMVEAQAKQVEALGEDIEEIRLRLKLRKLKGLRAMAQRSHWRMDKAPTDEGPAIAAWETWVALEKEVGDKLR